MPPTALRLAPRLKVVPALMAMVAVPAVIACEVLIAFVVLVTVTLPLLVVIPFVAPTVPTLNVAAALFVKLNALPEPLKLPASVPTLLLLVSVALPLANTFNPVAVIVVAPLCVTLPVTFNARLRPMLAVPSNKLIALVTLTSLVAPLLVNVTAPVKALFCPSVIALAPALKLDVPATVNTPDSEIAPPATATRLRPTVMAGKAMPALSNCNVKSRRLLKEARLVGINAPALVLRKLTSRMLPSVPLNVMAPLMLLALASNTSELAAVEERVITPAEAACVMVPVSVMLPPETSVNEPLPTLALAMMNGLVLVTETLLLPLLLRVTAPVRLLALPRVMALAPAVKLDVPGTVNAPVCEILPPAIIVRF